MARLPGEKGEVVIFNNKSIVETAAVVSPSSDANRISLKSAKSGHCLSGIEDVTRELFNSLDISRGHGGHAGGMLEKIECNPLSAKESARRTRHGSKAASRFEVASLFDKESNIDLGVDLFEDSLEEGDAGDAPSLAKEEPSGDPLIWADAGIRGDISRADIFGKSAADQLFDLSLFAITINFSHKPPG